MSHSSLSREFQATANPAQGRKKPLPPFSIRFTEAERARLNRDAGNLALSTYIRKKLFNVQAAHRKTPTRRPSVNDAALAQALSALGQSRLAQNMNQLAKASNAGNLHLKPKAHEALNDACADIAAMRRELLKALGLRAE